jgi:protein-tyrosine phosphatase
MGNICRSPTAEAVFRKRIAAAGLSERVECDSAGTHDVQLGVAPDGRARATALRRGYDVSRRGGRQIDDADFDRFDLILAMDRQNLSALRQRAASHHQAKIRLLLEFATRRADLEVPDPYYGSLRAFDLVLDMIEDACDGLLEHLIREHALLPPDGKDGAH